jgi:hypothetical protein
MMTIICLLSDHESVIVVLHEVINDSVILWQEQVTFWWDYDDIYMYVIIDKHVDLDVCSARLLAHSSNSPHVDMLLYSNKVSWLSVKQ